MRVALSIHQEGAIELRSVRPSERNQLIEVAPMHMIVPHGYLKAGWVVSTAVSAGCYSGTRDGHARQGFWRLGIGSSHVQKYPPSALKVWC